MKVAVVIATHNGERYLEEQLTTVLRQSRPPDQIILRDDCSTDRSVELATRVLAEATCEVDLAVQPYRLGAVQNFGRAIAAADADAIALCDQDDRWHEDKLEVLISHLEADADVAAAFSNARLIDDGSEVRPGSLWDAVGFSVGERRRFRSGDALGVLLRRNVITGCALVMRADLRSLVLPFFDSGWHDHAIGLLLAGAQHRIVATDQPLFDYRLHGSNAAGVAGTRRSQLRSRRSPQASLVRQIQFFEAIVHRLDASSPPTLADEVSEKLAHLRRRIALPHGRIPRVRSIGAEIASGDYVRYSAGLRSAAYDVVFSS